MSGEWDAFAHQGGSDEITGDAVVGRPIWAFIGGEDVHHLFRILFSRVRESGRSIRVPFRCDAPDTRRWQSLELTPAADVDGGIDVVVRNLHEEARSPVRILDPEADRSEETLIVCAWCKRTRIAEHGWVDLEEAAEHLALFGTDPVPRLSHGICPDCRSLVETTATGDSGDISVAGLDTGGARATELDAQKIPLSGPSGLELHPVSPLLLGPVESPVRRP